MFKGFKSIIFTLLVFGIVPFVLADTITNQCGTLNTPDTYILNESVNSNGTCFIIATQNVTLDCNGSSITYSLNGTANTFGIYTNQFNTTIKNCNIIDGNWTSSITSRQGIRLEGSNNSIIFNNFVNVSNSTAIYLLNSNSNDLNNNTGISNSSYGIQYSTSNNNILTNNTGISNTQDGWSAGIFITSSNNMVIDNFSGISNTGVGININICSNITLINILGNGTSSGYSNNMGIFVRFSSYITIVNSIAQSNGASALRFDSTQFSNVSNMIITSNDGKGLDIENSSYIVVNNATAASNTSYGIMISRYWDGTGFAFNNTIINSTSYSQISSAIFLNSYSVNNTFMYVNGTSGSGTGLSFYSNASNNNFIGLTAVGLLSGSDGIDITADSSNNVFRDCVNITGVTDDVYVDSSLSINNLFINCSYSISRELVDPGSASIIKKWYFNANVTNSTGSPLQNANVTTYNKTLAIIDSQLTDINGNIARTELTEYVNNGGTRTYETPQIINTTRTGYYSNTTTINITTTQNTIKTIILGNNPLEPTSCGTLGTANTIYNLAQNVTATGTCFTITAANITLDCQGNWITYSTAGVASTYGIYTNQFNTTIKNCNIIDGNWTSGAGTFRFGIYFNTNKNSTMLNNFVNTSNSVSINIYSNSNFNNLTNNTGISNSSTGIRVDSSSNNNILNNIGTSINGTSWGSSGFYVRFSSNNTLANNIGTGYSSEGILFENSSNNILNNNTGISISETGIYIDVSLDNNLTNNNGTSNSSYGVNIEGSLNHILINNTGTSYSNAGIVLSSATNNTLINNNGTSNSSAGMFFWAYSTNNTLINNTWISDSGDAITVYDSPNNILTGQIAKGISSGSNGIDMYNSSNNIFRDCVNISGVSHDIYLNSESTNNSFINCTYNLSKETVNGAGNELIRKWYFNANVTNSTGSPLQNANITTYNTSYSIVDSQLTDINGNINRIELIEYINNGGTRTYETPQTVNVTKAGYLTNTTNYNLTILGNVFTSIKLLESPPDTIPPNITFESNTDASGLITNRNNILINVTANDTALANITTNIYNSTFNLINITVSLTNNSLINFTVPSDGLYYFNATAYDQSNNSNSTETRNITIDTTMPTITINAPYLNLTNSNNIIFNISITDLHLNNATLYIYNSSNILINSTSSNTSQIFLNYTAPQDDTYYYNITAYDMVENYNASSTRNITVDTTPPNVIIVSPTNTIYNNKTLLVNITSDGTNIWFYNGTGNETYTSPVYKTFNEGQNILNVWANDTAGNTNYTNITFNIDTIAPNITINSPINKIYNVSSITFNSTLNEIGSCNLSLDFGVTNLSMGTTDNQNFNYTNSSMTDGNYNVTFYCADIAGNIQSKSETFKIDTINPSITVNASTDNITITNKNYITINVTATDANLNYTLIEIYNSTSVLINTTTGTYVNYTVPTDGTYYFNATAYDLAEHINSTETRNITIDTTNPSINIITPTNAAKNNLTQLVNISASDTHLDKIWYNYNGTNYTYNTEIEINFTEGSNTLHVWANDTAGNINYTNITFTINTTLPTITIISPQNIIYNNATILINITSNGNNTWFYNGTGNETYTNPLYWTFNEGTNILQAWTNDSVGNINYMNVTFIVDTINPSVIDNSGINTGYYNTTKTINITITDTNNFNASLYVNGSIVNTTTGTNNTTITYILTEGNYTYYITATDIANNTNTTTNITNIIIDTTTPTITITPHTYYTNETTIAISGTYTETNLQNITVNDVLATATAGNYNATITLTPNTNNTINITITDKAGLQNTTTDWIINDNIQPSITITSPTSTTYNQSSIEINITATDTNIDKIWYNYNGTNTTYTTPINISFTEGSNTLQVWANDTAGNTNYTNITFTVALNVAPTITLNMPQNNTHTGLNNNMLNITVYDANLDNITVYFYVDDNLEDTVVNQINGTILTYNTSIGEGLHNWTAVANDGKINSTKEYYYLTVDTTSPTIYYVAPTDNTSLVGRGYIIINVSANDTNLRNATVYIYNSTGALVYNITNVTSSLAQIYVNYTVPADGLYYYNASAHDDVHSSFTDTLNITTDTLQPNSTFYQPSDNGNINRQYILINTTANKNDISNITINLYNSSQILINSTTIYASSALVNITNLTDGIYYYNTTVYDIFDRVGYSLTRNVTINTQFPMILFSSPTDAGPFVNRNDILVNTSTTGVNITNVTINLYNSTGGLINFTNDNQSSILYNFSGLSEGDYYVNATVLNSLNYTATTETLNITIDTTRPIITFTSNTDNGTIVNRSYILINVSATDTYLQNTTINVYDNNMILLYNITTSNNNFILNYTIPSDGMYYFNATAYDSAGNSNNTETINVTADFKNPTINFVYPTENRTVIGINYIVINVSSYDVFFNNITAEIYDSNYTIISINSTTSNDLLLNFSGLTDGTYYLNATSYDNFGHLNSTNTLNITIDTVAPSIMFNYPASDAITINVSTIIINVTASDTNFLNSTIYVYNSIGSLINNQTKNTPENVITISSLSDGTYYYNATTYDSAGNKNSTITRSIIVDTTVPSGNSNPSTGGGGSSGSSGGGGGTGGIEINNIVADNEAKILPFNQYWPNIINGSRTVNIDQTGIPITQIILVTNSNINVANTLKITIQSNNSNNQNISALIYTQLLIDATIDQKYVNNISLKFKVSKNWLAKNNLTASNITLYTNNNNNNWSNVNVSKYAEDAAYIYYSTNISRLSNMAIGSPIIPEANSTKENITTAIETTATPNVSNESNIIKSDLTQKSFLKHIWSSILGEANKLYHNIASIQLSRESQALVVVAISSILTLILGVVTGVLVYKNAIKPKRIRRNYNKRIISGRIMPYTEELPLVQTPTTPQPPQPQPEQIKTDKIPPMPTEIPTAQDPEFYVRKISQLLLQCEYALDNGKIEDAKNYYAEARAIYFHSDIDYEYKARVYDKIISLHGILNK